MAVGRGVMAGRGGGSVKGRITVAKAFTTKPLRSRVGARQRCHFRLKTTSTALVGTPQLRCAVSHLFGLL